MALTLEQIRELILEGESNRLDFKREQYRFVGLSGPDGDKEKAKLLKDVLAFANAFRKDPAFILVGVDESPSRNQAVAGIPKQDVIDDATLQQFVNSKTNRLIPFRAYSVPCPNANVVQDVEIDPCADQRPFHLKKEFGGIATDEVWFRSGSSNTRATPDDIYRMGAEQYKRSRPVLECEIESPNLIPGTDQVLILQVHPAPCTNESNRVPYNTFERRRDSPTNIEMYDWLTQVLGCVHFMVSITNHSSVTAEKVLVETTIEPDEVTAFDQCRFFELIESNRLLHPLTPTLRMNDPSVVRPDQTERGLGRISGWISGGGRIRVVAFVYVDNMPRIKVEKKFSFLRSALDIPHNTLQEQYQRFGNPFALFSFLRAEASKMKQVLDQFFTGDSENSATTNP